MASNISRPSILQIFSVSRRSISITCNASPTSSAPHAPSVSLRCLLHNWFARIFSNKKWQKCYEELAPQVSEANSLSVFHSADEEVVRAVNDLRRATRPDRVAFHTERVHRAQSALLAAIYSLMGYVPSMCRAQREYLSMLPAIDQEELGQGYSESILFASQAIFRGFRIRGLEVYHQELSGPAQQLCTVFETLRLVFRKRMTKKSLDPEIISEIISALIDFDHAWSAFESRLCTSYISLLRQSITNGRQHTQAPAEYGILACSHQVRQLSRLLSEALSSALKKELFSSEDAQSLEPFVLLALPRLAILQCLVRRENNNEWFIDKDQEFIELAEAVQLLETHQICELERMLVYGAGDNEAEHVGWIFKKLCQLSDCGNRQELLAAFHYALEASL
ncbi:uncharacterized protein VTP21DRAFT_6491 [Calcarisporiella thermophila]|uniref:uncharacterized protein n=1 Tax=Calcarisporiella thermophila TaxID=911321 RepID=UPI003742DC58